jgi:hypothetical protein
LIATHHRSPIMSISRRRFLHTAAASAALGLSKNRLRAQVVPSAEADVHVEIDLQKRGFTIPADYTGLSYEAAQLADPTFFSAKNRGLVEEFRALGPRGILRFGGCLAEFTNWWDPSVTPQRPAMTPQMAAGQSRFEWIMVTPSVSKDKYAVLTPESHRQLRGFLDATGWTALYGLNLGCGTPERASLEAASAVHHLGDRLTAFQVGNEADHFNAWKRPPSWNFNSYWNEYTTFVKTIRARTPSARFAGPDAANRVEWVQQYAEHAKSDAVLLTSHYYRMGPANAPGINNELLLTPNPLLAPRIAAVMAATNVAGISYRATEVNSCSHGGMKGVSDAFASALWIADYMLQVGQSGFKGVNVHGGGIEGVYSPIVGDPKAGYTARPITFGMRFANEFSGATFAGCQLRTNGRNITGYAARKQGKLLLALFNKTDKPVNMAITGASEFRHKTVTVLRAPTLSSTSDITFGPIKEPKTLPAVAPYTAALVEYRA